MIPSLPTGPVRRSPPALSVAALGAMASLFAAPTAIADVEALLGKADRRFAKGGYERAADLYAKADRKADGRSVDALIGLARTGLKLGEYGEVVATARRWHALADRAEVRAAARLLEAEGHYWQGMTARWRAIDERHRRQLAADDGPPLPGRGALQAAVAAIREGLPGAGPGSVRTAGWLLLADALVELGDLAGARQALEGFAAAGGSDSYADNLRCWIDQLESSSAEDATAPGIDPPERIYTPFPGYTAEARAAGAQGTMRLRMAVNGQGDVRCLRVVRGLPYGLVRSTTERVLEWRFVPAFRDGQPVPVLFDLTIDFRLQ